MKFFLIAILFHIFFLSCSGNTDTKNDISDSVNDEMLDDSDSFAMHDFIDPESGLQWSETVADSMSLSNGVKYCKNLVENGYDDFILPSVEQLWTLAVKCEDFSVESGCQDANDGRYSKFGDTGRFWSSSYEYIEDIVSVKSPYPVPLFFDFDNLKEGYEGIYPDTIYKIRCVRDYIVTGTEKKDQPCSPLPENGSWNSVDKITQTWNGSEWVPSTETAYNEEPSTDECRFVCIEGYIEYDGSCVEPVMIEKWSMRSTLKMGTLQAFDYCENLDENGFSDWKLPTISEIRSIAVNCPAIETDGNCRVTDECLSKSTCWSDKCNGCGVVMTGKYSIFGDEEAFYTVSPNTESWEKDLTLENDKESYLSDVWVLDFRLSRIYNDYFKTENYVRCVRH
ncbi:MAG TPA: DUF1566 domain-containing protein [bacterium]|nr:DUF1566 domain-containing protein [bacterium]